MKLLFVFPGKTKDRNLLGLAQDYFARIRKHMPCELIELKEKKDIYARDTKKMIQKEGEVLGKYMGSGTFTVCLDDNGKQYSTEGLAAMLDGKMNSGFKQINFIIGGPYGLAEEILERSELKISLSKMTFTHDMSRVLLLEQVYRALTIIRGGKYHH